MSNFTFKPLSLAVFAMLSAGTLSAQNYNLSPVLGTSGNGLTLMQVNDHGDFMGIAGTNSNLKHYYYYDNQGRLVRVSDMGRDASNGSYQMTNYDFYEYNAQNQLVWTYTRQFGLYKEDYFTFNDHCIDSTSYTYNEAGKLASKKSTSETTTYTYDSEGNLVEEKSVTAGGEVIYDRVYSDFIAPNLPKKVVSTSDAYDNCRYTEDRVYNDQNLQTKMERYQLSEDIDENGQPVTKRRDILREEVAYDATGFKTSQCTYVEVSEGLGLEPSDSLAYTRDADNSNIVYSQAYEYIDEIDVNTGQPMGWQTKGTYYEYIYRKLDTSLSVPVEVSEIEGDLNNNKVTFKLDGNLLAGHYRFDLYRDGSLLHTADLSDEKAFDATTGTYTYVDSPLVNDRHDYFVQTVVTDELGQAEEPNVVSNLAEITNNLELPSVTNVQYSEYRRAKAAENTANGWGTGQGYFVNVTWNPISEADSLKYGLLRYDFMVGNDASPSNKEYINETTGQKVNAGATGHENAWEVGMKSKSATQTVDIQCSYPYGRSHYKIEVKMKEVLAGVQETLAGDVKATYDGTSVLLTQPSQVKVFDASGATVKQAANATSVSLTGLPKGAYVVVVVNGGEVSALKVVR